MPLEDWDPFQELNRLRKRFDELFERGFRSGLAGEAVEEHWTPPVDVLEGDGLMLVLVEIPGIAQRDIDLQFTDGRLVMVFDESSTTTTAKAVTAEHVATTTADIRPGVTASPGPATRPAGMP